MQRAESSQKPRCRKLCEQSSNGAWRHTTAEQDQIFWTVCLLCALTGRTDAESIADYWNSHRKSLFKGFETGAEYDISAYTVLKLMSLLTVEKSSALANTFVKSRTASQKCEDTMPTIEAIDGQSVRASRIDGKRCGHILNLYNCSEHSFMGQCLIESKKSEVSSTRELLEPYDLQGTLITADALFSKQNMFAAIVNKQADYCIPVKDNAKLVKKAIDATFTATLSGDVRQEKNPSFGTGNENRTRSHRGTCHRRSSGFSAPSEDAQSMGGT